MVTNTTLLQHPLHERHPLEPRDFSKGSQHPVCHLCSWKILADGYTCEECMFHVHRACSEAPPQIDSHPSHDYHTLTLTHHPQPFICYNCDEQFISVGASFRCDECEIDVDVRCVMAYLFSLGDSLRKTPELIWLPIHIHELTLFSTRHDFVGDSNCVICKASVKEEWGYMCLRRECEFLIHKRCVQDLFGNEYDCYVDITCSSSTLLDRREFEGKAPKWIALQLHHHLLTLFSAKYDFVEVGNCVICEESIKGEGDGYMCLHWKCEFHVHNACVQGRYYADETKAPQVYHRHPLETFLGDSTGLARCVNCGSEASSGEFIGCGRCQVFIHRDCIQVPETIQYPHHRDHTLVLLIDCPDNEKSRCNSCTVSLKGKLCYACPSCEFFVDLRCALQVLAYCEEGMSAEIELPWHEHQVQLCHRTECDSIYCFCCGDKSTGPMYECKDQDCSVILHKRCIENQPTIISRHHPDHPLTFCDISFDKICSVCCYGIMFKAFSCELCAFYLHSSCAAHAPTLKHPLHEHELLNLDNARFWECNRCGTSTAGSLFRCVPCNFNLHEVCMELPRLVKSEIHWHPLTLQNTFVEDDSGEYYCEHCEKKRDIRLGVYVCGRCQLSIPRIYHIECALPELGKTYADKIQTSANKIMAGRITRKSEQVRAAEEKLEEDKLVLAELKRELDELMKENAELIS